MNQIHILNGDALKEQFPEEVSGEIIVARECLVQGPVQSNSLEELLSIRADYINEAFGEADYSSSKDEILKIAALNDGEINLWFEEDLFCQINLWFTCSLLYLKNHKVNLVIPKDSLRYGFGGLSQEQLVQTFKTRISLTPINVNQFAILWFAYKKDHIERLLKLGVQMYSDFPFVMKAIEAHFERQPRDGNPGLPERTLREIIKEESTNDFGTVFKAFCERLPIYGYGDLQVKQIYDSIIANQ
ncbi:DUF1835 domain-containing protein [Ekhidna sp.]